MLGNTGDSVPNQIIGAYNPATDFVLGDYGVDPIDGRVWAVLDHNSTYAASEAIIAPVPEPSTYLLLLLGAVSLVATAGSRSALDRAD